MKKRLLAGCLIFCLIASLTACSSGSSETTAATEAEETESVESTASEAETEEESETVLFTPGTYTGTATGMDGTISIEVTFDESSITDISVIDENETAGVGQKAVEIMTERILESQSLSVDSVSGATVTSAAVRSAVQSAVEQAGGNVSVMNALAEENASNEQAVESYDYDVVVAGSGIAGLMAAAEAADSGAHVAIIEKLGIVGGTSIYSSGAFLTAADEDDIQTMTDSWINRNTIQEKNPVDEEKVAAIAAAAPDALALISQSGVDYSVTGTLFKPAASERSVLNAASIELASVSSTEKGGANLISYMESLCEDLGVDIYLNTPATSLIIDDDGSVIGVMSETDDAVLTFNAPAVILATGDYARNTELSKEICPTSVGNYTSTSVGNTGDGITMALEAGAVLYDFQETMSGVFAPDPYDMPVVGQPNNSYPYSCLLVTPDGERVVSETAGSHDQMYYFTNLEGADYGWVVMDQEIADEFLNLDDYLNKTESGSSYIFAYKEDSLEALADDMGVDYETLQATVDRYNELCEAGEDEDFGKEAEYLSAIDDGTYYAVKEYNMTRGNYGGIVTNVNGEVTDADDAAIPGLYAAGIISSGGFFGDYYPGAEALGVGAYMGYISGQNAAAYATAE